MGEEVKVKEEVKLSAEIKPESKLWSFTKKVAVLTGKGLLVGAITGAVLFAIPTFGGQLGALLVAKTAATSVLHGLGSSLMTLPANVLNDTAFPTLFGAFQEWLQGTVVITGIGAVVGGAIGAVSKSPTPPAVVFSETDTVKRRVSSSLAFAPSQEQERASSNFQAKETARRQATVLAAQQK